MWLLLWASTWRGPCEAARLRAGGEQKGPAKHLLQRACDQLQSPGRGGKGLDQQTEVKQLFWHIKEAVTEHTQFTTQPRVQTQNTVERGRSPEVGGHWESWLSSEGRGTLGQAGQGWEKSAQRSTVSYNSMPLKSWVGLVLHLGSPPKKLLRKRDGVGHQAHM